MANLKIGKLSFQFILSGLARKINALFTVNFLFRIQIALTAKVAVTKKAIPQMMMQLLMPTHLL